MNRTRNVVLSVLAALLFLTGASLARAASIAVDPINLSVNGTVRDIGKIDANLNGNTMDTTFTLDVGWAHLTMCTEFQWLQVVTELVADAGNPTYNMAALVIPIIDTPSGGYDGQVGEDALPWYLTAADIANNNLNGTNGDGSKFFKTNDTPSVKGAKFDTWIVATTAAKEFNVIAGFEWGSGTLGGAASLVGKNSATAPTMAHIDTINTALANGAFAGWTAKRGINIVCVPEPGGATLVLIAAALTWRMRPRMSIARLAA